MGGLFVVFVATAFACCCRLPRGTIASGVPICAPPCGLETALDLGHLDSVLLSLHTWRVLPEVFGFGGATSLWSFVGVLAAGCASLPQTIGAGTGMLAVTYIRHRVYVFNGPVKAIYISKRKFVFVQLVLHI